jgi:hypothetical protein
VFGTFVQTATPATLVSHYTIAGRSLCIEAQDDWTSEWVASFLKGFYLKPTAVADEERAAVNIRVQRAAPPVVPSGLQTFAINHGVCHTDGTHYFLVVDESLVCIKEPASRTIEVTFGTSAHACHPVALVNVFSYGLQAALRRAGAYDLHAAGVVEPATGAGALIVGTSSSGKTTLTLKLAARGWRYLSDDMVLLHETRAGLEAAGLRKLFSVAAASLAGSQLPQLEAALGAPVASDPSKRRLVPEIIFPDARAASCRARVLFFPQVVDADETTICEMPARIAMQQLLRLCPWATYDAHTAPDYLRVLARLANECRAYELRAGRDLLHDQARAADLLAPYLKE